MSEHMLRTVATNDYTHRTAYPFNYANAFMSVCIVLKDKSLHELDVVDAACSHTDWMNYTKTHASDRKHTLIERGQ